MPHDEEQVRQLVRQMYQSAEEAQWELEPEQVRTEARRRRFHWPEAKVLVLVGTAAALIVIGFAVTVGSGSHSSTAKRTTSTTTPPRKHATSPPATTAPTTTLPSTPPATEPTQLPLVVCPTTFGYPAPAPDILPASVPVNAPRSLVGQLTVYSDNQGQMKLVGPSGWTCQALIAADGSGGVVLSRPGEAVPQTWAAGWSLSPDSTIQAVVMTQTSACWSCTLDQACPLFPAAATTLAGQERSCSAGRPASESERQINSGLVSFEDPPSVAGDGVPSGGQNPSNGVMTYDPNNQGGSWLETCTLPTTEKELCTTTLNAFITWYGQS